MLRLLALCAVVIVSGACTPPGPPIDADAAADCDGRALDKCESAIVAADSADTAAALMDRYAKARPEWQEAWRALRDSKAAVWLGSTAGAPDGVTRVAMPPAPEAVSLAALVLAVARAPHVFAGASQLFPGDVLSPHVLELPAVIEADASRAAADIAVAAAIRSAVRAAQGYDYIRAAAEAERLRAMVAPRSDEAALRGRFAVQLLDAASITLLQEGDEPAQSPEPSGALSSPYAELLAVKIAAEQIEAWNARRAAITAGMDERRVAALSYLYGDPKDCPKGFVPPMERAADLAFAGMLAGALDPAAAPGGETASGKVDVEAWLPSYEKMVVLIDRTRSSWLLSGTMLTQRGELFGLSASATKTYKRVSELAQFHVDALSRLAKEHPTRFQTLGVVALVYQPGAIGDTNLRNSLSQLVQQSVSQKIEATDEVGGLWEAGLASFAIGTSYPAAMQLPHFQALRQAMYKKLSSSFGDRGGWSIAGLTAAGAVLGTMLGDKSALSGASPAVIKALAIGDIEQPGLAAIVSAAIAYAEVGARQKLDADVSNPKMFSAGRTTARAQLEAALSKIGAGGPVTPPEKELLARTLDYGDGLIVALVTRYMAEDKGVVCAGESSIGDTSKLRDAFDRLQKKRRTLIEHAAFRGKDGSSWAKRARLVALIFSDLLDVTDDTGGTVKFTVPEADAQRIADVALRDFTEEDWGGVAGGLYLLARGGVGEDAPKSDNVIKNAKATLAGLSKMFGRRHIAVHQARGQQHQHDRRLAERAVGACPTRLQSRRSRRWRSAADDPVGAADHTRRAGRSGTDRYGARARAAGLFCRCSPTARTFTTAATRRVWRGRRAMRSKERATRPILAPCWPCARPVMRFAAASGKRACRCSCACSTMRNDAASPSRDNCFGTSNGAATKPSTPSRASRWAAICWPARAAFKSVWAWCRARGTAAAWR